MFQLVRLPRMSSALKARIQKGLGHHGEDRQPPQVAPDVVGVEQAHRQAVAEQWEGQPADPPEYGRLREEGPANVIQQHGGNGDQLEQVGVQVGAQLSLLGFHDLIPPVFQLSLPSGGIPDGFHRWKRASGLALGLGRGFFRRRLLCRRLLGSGRLLGGRLFWRWSFWPPPFGRACFSSSGGAPSCRTLRRGRSFFLLGPADPQAGSWGTRDDAEGLLEPPGPDFLNRGMAALGTDLLQPALSQVMKVAPLGSRPCWSCSRSRSRRIPAWRSF